MRLYRSTILAVAAVLVFTTIVSAQAKRRPKPVVKKPAVTSVAPAPEPTPVDPPPVKTETKKNERPAANNSNVKASTQPAIDPVYFYEFTQPEFDIRKIVIEHDEAGRGTITFTKKMFGDAVSDPLTVSRDALDRINAAFTALNFIDSNENYQYEKDYSHLGVNTFKLKKGDKQRTTVFNYTVNKEAKILMDEYRKLSNQYIWVFDISVARDNQPLESPKLLDSLDSLMRRNEISDATQLLPLLKEMKDDERIPLIARNHSNKLVERIEKGKK